MLVEKAKKLLCPIIEENQDCFTCECMFWRWFDPDTKNEGYCGLAGKEGAE